MRAVLTAVAALGLAASAQAAVLFSFETGTDGFVFDMGNLTMASSTTGATAGAQSLAVTNSGYSQIKVELTPAQWAEVVANPKVRIDFTVPSGTLWDSWGGWWGKLNMAMNSETGGWKGATEFDMSAGGKVPAGTRTATFDFTNVDLPANPGGWHQLFVSFNWGTQVLPPDGATSGPSTLYVDNIQTLPVPEPTVVAGLAAASLGLMLRKRQK